MTRTLRIIASAKINWTLEVLRIRPDGYHEVRSVLQTVDLHDVVTLSDAPEIELVVSGEAGPLADNARETNLAYRAADVLRERASVKRGVRIGLVKHIPVAAGLGGGSSDAAAVLRGLNVLWSLHEHDANLMEIAAELGSDPPFFVVSGTGAVSGRGEVVEALPNAPATQILLATPPATERGNKTAAMFEALTPGDFSDGYVTIGVRETALAGRRIVDEELNNVFERVTSKLQPQTELAMDALRNEGWQPHLAGAGPSFFLLLHEAPHESERLIARVRELGFEPRVVRTLSRARALRIETV